MLESRACEGQGNKIKSYETFTVWGWRGFFISYHLSKNTRVRPPPTDQCVVFEDRTFRLVPCGLVGHPAVRRTSVVFLDFTDEWIICFSLSKEKAVAVLIGLLIMKMHSL